MNEMSSIRFVYKDTVYHAIVRIKQGSGREYHITIMNGELESLLYGNHVFLEKNGVFVNTVLSDNEAILTLREAILRGLEQMYSPASTQNESS